MAAKKSSLWSRLTGRGDTSAGRGDITCYISYSNRDGRIYATRLRERLQQYGVRTLFDEAEIVGGSLWVEALQENLSRADILIVVVTPSALASDWVLRE